MDRQKNKHRFVSRTRFKSWDTITDYTGQPAFVELLQVDTTQLTQVPASEPVIVMISTRTVFLN